jgi:hypothetical protein
MLSKGDSRFLFVVFLALTGIAAWKLFSRLLPANDEKIKVALSSYPAPVILSPDTSVHQLTVKNYRQIGRELHLLLYSHSARLSPFEAQVEQNGVLKEPIAIPPRPGSWLRFTLPPLEDGPFILHLKSLQDSTCSVRSLLHFHEQLAHEIADSTLWFRHGSDDELLDVRVVKKGEAYYLKDFANYSDGRSRTYLLEGMIIDSLDWGVEVKPGYLYSVSARWIDGSYTQWWNRKKRRSSRLQAVWIEPDPSSLPSGERAGRLTQIAIPYWFKPSPTFNPHFDTLFPKFTPIHEKLVMMYRLNQDVPVQSYFQRGVTHLPRWEHDAPPSKQHWTEPPGFFGDKDQNWFGGLSRKEVEEYADRVAAIGAYSFDFEFWNRQYTPNVKQRLLWFSNRLKANNPNLYLFDYWGGSAYHNTTFQDKNGVFSPSHFLADYERPRSNHFNFGPLNDGDFFGNYFNITSVDVYPRPPLLVGSELFNLNNYLVLSAIHASRINRLFDYQKTNKTLWFAWNRFMPLYHDPPFVWQQETSDPQGTLHFVGLETIPASQALALSVFSLIEGDGFYLWSDSQPWGRGDSNYRIDETTLTYAPANWWPRDGIEGIQGFTGKDGVNESPRYWDYPSDYFALGNWMAKNTEHILNGGKSRDLPFFENNQWHSPQKGQAVVAASERQPFVTSVVNGDSILVVGIHSFQPPNQTTRLPIKLPDETRAEIELYGNWPSLYKGKLRASSDQ